MRGNGKENARAQGALCVSPHVAGDLRDPEHVQDDGQQAEDSAKVVRQEDSSQHAGVEARVHLGGLAASVLVGAQRVLGLPQGQEEAHFEDGKKDEFEERRRGEAIEDGVCKKKQRRKLFTGDRGEIKLRQKKKKKKKRRRTHQ